MAQPGQVTLYGQWYSPFNHRVEMALIEAKADYTVYDVNLGDKPSWYVEKVNPIGKIPAITYGGPKTPPEEPSSESAKLYESLVIVEFIAEAFPESKLLPADLVTRARARIFMTVFENQWVATYRPFMLGQGAMTPVVEAFETLQKLLPETGFAVGKWSMADVVAAPFFARFELQCSHEIGKYPLGEGKKMMDELASPKFSRMRKYMNDVLQRPSFKETYDEAKSLEIWKANPYVQRE